MAGAIGHMSCEMIVDINTEMVRIGVTIQDFLDPAVVIEDPRRGSCGDSLSFKRYGNTKSFV